MALVTNIGALNFDISPPQNIPAIINALDHVHPTFVFSSFHYPHI